MSEGDSVFIGPATVTEVNGPWIDVAIHGNNSDMTVSPYTLIPDVPNLAHIARFLADHPETVDALETQMHQSFGLGGETKSSQLAVGFLKAMRGEGGHE